MLTVLLVTPWLMRSQTPIWALGLLFGAAIVALLAAVWSWVKPGRNANSGLLILVCGLAGVAHFAYVFGVQLRNSAASLIPTLSPGFWIALAGTLGLIVQAAFTRTIKSSAPDGNPAGAAPAAKRGNPAQPKPAARTHTPSIANGLAQSTHRPIKKRGGVSLGQNIAVAFDALWANKLRSVLTMLGIVIGVMSVVALVSVGQGATADIPTRIEGIGTNLISISAARGFGRTSLTLEDSEAIKEGVSGLAGVAPQMSTSASVATGDLSYTATVVGTTPDYAIVRNLELTEGRFFDQDEYDGKSRVVVLGSGVRGGNLPLFRSAGQHRADWIADLRSGRRPGGTGQRHRRQRQRAGLPAAEHGLPALFTSRGVVGTEYQVSSIQISAEEPDQVSLIVAEITDLLRARHDLDLEDDDDFMSHESAGPAGVALRSERHADRAAGRDRQRLAAGRAGSAS